MNKINKFINKYILNNEEIKPENVLVKIKTRKQLKRVILSIQGNDERISNFGKYYDYSEVEDISFLFENKKYKNIKEPFLNDGVLRNSLLYVIGGSY